MQEYKQYVQAINKIYECLNIMKAKWDDQDNHNYIESIEEYKQIVIKYAEAFKVAIAPKKTEAEE